jgi:uncharacterized membrane protein YhhN
MRILLLMFPSSKKPSSNTDLEAMLNSAAVLLYKHKHLYSIHLFYLGHCCYYCISLQTQATY